MRNPARTILATLAVLVAVVASGSLVLSARASTGIAGPRLGVYMDGNNTNLDTYTSSWTVKPNVASFYMNWPGSVPTKMSTYATQGRTLQVELTGKIDSTHFVRWGDIAAGKYDTQLVSYITKLDALGTQVLLALENEPELKISDNTKSAPNQTAAQYVAAANHVADLIHNHSTRVESMDWLAGGGSTAGNFLFAHAKMDNVSWDPYKTGSHKTENATTRFATFINNVLIPKGYGDVPRRISETGIVTDKLHDGTYFSTATQIAWWNSVPAAMANDRLVSVTWFRANVGAHNYIPTDPAVDAAFRDMLAATIG